MPRAQPKSWAGSLPNIEDEERKLKAPQGENTIEGAGKDKMLAAPPPQEPKGEANSEKLDPDPTKEIARIVPPAAPKPITQSKPQIAPPGPETKLAAQSQKPDAAAADSENALKRKPIACGANATLPLHSLLRVREGIVFKLMTNDETSMSIQLNQSAHDLLVSPNYRYYRRLNIFGVNDRRRSVVILPPDISAKVGDRVEYQTGRPDPSMPCHYIPALVLRVL